MAPSGVDNKFCLITSSRVKQIIPNNFTGHNLSFVEKQVLSASHDKCYSRSACSCGIYNNNWYSDMPHYRFPSMILVLHQYEVLSHSDWYNFNLLVHQYCISNHRKYLYLPQCLKLAVLVGHNIDNKGTTAFHVYHLCN